MHKFTDIGMGIILIENELYEDPRGFMAEWYNRELFAENGATLDLTQIKTSKSKKGVLRGFHFQLPPYEQAKIVRCVTGEVFFAAVDVRKDSKNFGKYVSISLKADSKNAVFVPKGFASGFLVLSSEDAIIMYYIDGAWKQDKETGVIWNDPDVNVKWPVVPSTISKRDQELPRLKDIRW